MRANWNNISIIILLVFVGFIFYKLATYSSHSSGHDHDHPHRHQHVKQSEKTTSGEQTTHEKILKLKLLQAEKQIMHLKDLLQKTRIKKDDKRETKDEHKKFSGHKLVHLDLKGAPPKMPYLIKLLSYFKKWGATGVLVEYEDMFPYSDELKILKTSNAYSKNDITHFLKECEIQKLIVVPLIQTFGHFEFVLKHKKFADLRETALATNSLCPNNNGSIPLVKKIIDQVLALHPKLEYFHVGGDEVFNIKTCSKCLADQRNKSRLFIDHMTPILKHLKQKNIMPLMWDDMMRTASITEMKELGSLMEPMVWGYGAIKQDYYPEGMWDRFAAVFPKMWGASAFKGATKPNSDYVPIKFHLQNNMDWLDVINSLPSTTTVQGLALTGWSRFDHFAALCELLPAALPSLAFSLKALNNGYMDKVLEKEVIESLGLPKNFRLKMTPYKRKYKDVPATFPGHEIYTLVGNLTKALYKLTGIKHLKTAWMLQRQVDNKFLSYQHVHNALNFSHYAFDHLTALKQEVLEPLQEVYDDEVVKEWVEDKITANIRYAQTKMKQLSDLENTLE